MSGNEEALSTAGAIIAGVGGFLHEVDTVPVKYDPSKPHKARISTALRLWVAPAILVLLDGGLLVGGLVLMQQG